jgi:hypothetical protein
MNTVTLQQLAEKAREMALRNIWGENAFKINMAILKADRCNCAAYTRLAKYYRLNDNIAEAKNMYLKVLEIDSNNRGAINNLIDIEKEQKENESIDKIGSTGELFKEGQNSVLKGKYRRAVKLFSKAYCIEPLLIYAVNLAGVYKKMGKNDSIEELYEQLLKDVRIKADVDAINNEFKTLLPNENSQAEQDKEINIT